MPPLPTAPLQTHQVATAAGHALLALFGLHLLFGVVRLPDKVWARRAADVASYREQGAAQFLLGSARLDGAEAIEWLLANTGAGEVVLWREPADRALEFAGALLAPRLLVDERMIPEGARTFAGLPIATGSVPAGASGLIVLRGAEGGGLRLEARPR